MHCTRPATLELQFQEEATKGRADHILLDSASSVQYKNAHMPRGLWISHLEVGVPTEMLSRGLE